MATRSLKREAFEAHCERAGLGWSYAKEGVAICDDPESVGDEVSRKAVVRLRVWGFALPARDVDLFRDLAQAGLGTYLFEPTKGFIRIRPDRLGRMTGAMGRPAHRPAVGGASPVDDDRTVASSAGRRERFHEQPKVVGEVLDRNVSSVPQECWELRVVRADGTAVKYRDPYGKGRLGFWWHPGMAVGQCCRAPMLACVEHDPEGRCRLETEYQGQTGECCDEFFLASHGARGSCKNRNTAA